MAATARTLLALAPALALIGCGSDAEPPRGETTAEHGADIAESNQPPEIRRVVLRPAHPRPGERVTAHAEATDPDGDPLTLTYSWSIDGRPVEGQASIPLKAVAKDSLIELVVVAHDGPSASRAATATTRVGNREPTMLGLSFEPRGGVTTEQDVVANPQAMDPDGDALSFAYTWWVNGRRVSADAEVLPHEIHRRGDRIELDVAASDGTDESETMHSEAIEVANSAPRITSVPGGVDFEGTFQYAVEVTDPDGDRRFRFRLLEGPPGMRVDLLKGLVHWEPLGSQSGRHPVVIEVDDLAGGRTTQAFEVDVALAPDPLPASPAD